MSTNTWLLDSLYGEIEFDQPLLRLMSAPVVQRLRHVRLSNIDSLAMPGISGGSRYEHVLGVAHLAKKTGLAQRLSVRDRTALVAAALLHDWAITAFGHLVEEGFGYAGIEFDHEQKLQELAQDDAESSEIGGINRQIFCGRQSGLGAWINSIASPAERDGVLLDITNAIRGKGRFGKVVCGDIDIDNIDGVFRIAFHMGLPVDRAVPLELAKSIVGVEAKSGLPAFKRESLALIETWQKTRALVYERLMPAQPDFAAKLMLLRCTFLACKEQEILPQDWNLTDFEFISRLKTSKSDECRKTVDRWQVGEFWSTTPLVWLSGKRPNLPELARFSEDLTHRLKRDCLAYGIKDKRTRDCHVAWDTGEVAVIGQAPTRWLLGVGSSKSRPFTHSEAAIVLEEAEKRFSSKEVSSQYDDQQSRDEDQFRLI